MSGYIIQRKLFILPSIEGEDLLVYGIQKFKNNFKVITLKETISPEGGEWVFIYDGKLNRLFIEKQGIQYRFTGDISPDSIEAMKKLFSKY